MCNYGHDTSRLFLAQGHNNEGVIIEPIQHTCYCMRNTDSPLFNNNSKLYLNTAAVVVYLVRIELVIRLISETSFRYIVFNRSVFVGIYMNPSQYGHLFESH